MQEQSSARRGRRENRGYNASMPRNLTKQRSEQGARLAAYRRAAGLSQTELAELIGEAQQNVAYWEQSEKPPRSDVLLKMAKILGVSVEQLVTAKASQGKRGGPVGKVRKAFEAVSGLPRRQQDKIVEIVDAMVEQYRRSKAS